jgi:sorting nexin-27
MAGRHLCSRRYSEFVMLHTALKREFVDFNFPKLPGKWLFTLNEQQLDSRRRGLELYLEKICAVRVIAESDIVQDFLSDVDTEQTGVINVDLKVLLPDHRVISFSVKKNATADEVYRVVLSEINMNPETARFFALFELIEYNFERKIQMNEYPHSIYIQNYSTATSTCLALRKWAFLPEVETWLMADKQAMTYLYYQAIEDVNRGYIQAGNTLYHKMEDYLGLARTLQGYGEIRFPHSACDARKGGHVIPIVSGKNFKLEACSVEGEPEGQVIEFEWNTIMQWEIDEKNLSMNFLYSRATKPARWVKIFNAFVSYFSSLILNFSNHFTTVLGFGKENC